ncbi:MAG: DUF559 domain-containing protein [Myxococcota bacterium]
MDAKVACAQQAAERHGVLTRAQARALLTRDQVKRQLKTGAWVRVYPQVFRVAGAPQTYTQQQHAVAAWLGARGVLSHRTAALLHGLELSAKEPLDVTVKHRVKGPAGVKVYRRKLGAKETTELDGLRVTTVERTLFDLASCVDSADLKALVTQALRKQLTTLEALRKVAAWKGWPGVGALRKVLAELDGQGGPTESALEDRVLELLEQAELPKPTVQKQVKAGKRRARLDFLYEAQRVVIEADGYAYHADVKSFEADRQRRNALIARGYRVLQWTWRALDERPEELVAELQAALLTAR